MMVSLDHTVWFHRIAALSTEHDWLLMRLRSPNLASARGFALAELFSREGILVASCAQEGLIRMRRGYALPPMPPGNKTGDGGAEDTNADMADGSGDLGASHDDASHGCAKPAWISKL